MGKHSKLFFETASLQACSSWICCCLTEYPRWVNRRYEKYYWAYCFKPYTILPYGFLAFIQPYKHATDFSFALLSLLLLLPAAELGILDIEDSVYSSTIIIIEALGFLLFLSIDGLNVCKTDSFTANDNLIVDGQESKSANGIGQECVRTDEEIDQTSNEANLISLSTQSKEIKDQVTLARGRGCDQLGRLPYATHTSNLKLRFYFWSAPEAEGKDDAC